MKTTFDINAALADAGIDEQIPEIQEIDQQSRQPEQQKTAAIADLISIYKRYNGLEMKETEACRIINRAIKDKILEPDFILHFADKSDEPHRELLKTSINIAHIVNDPAGHDKMLFLNPVAPGVFRFFANIAKQNPFIKQEGGSLCFKLAISELSTEIELKAACKKILNRREESVGDFDSSKLPEPLKNYLHDLSQETSADPVMILQSLLCAISASIGKRMYIPERYAFQKLYPNLWCLTINDSGQFKTTSLNKGSRIAFKINKQINDKIKQLQVEKGKAENKQHYDAQIENFRKERPVLPDKQTAEGLMGLLQSTEKNHMGGQIICSEFSDWLGNLSKSHNSGFKPLLTALYDVPETYEYITKTGGLMILDRPFITINAVSTMDWLNKDIQSDDISSGFLARFLLFYPPAKKEIPPAFPPAFNINLDNENKVMGILNQIRQFELFREYELSQESMKLFSIVHHEFYKNIWAETENIQKIINPFLKRWSPALLKLSQLMQPFHNLESKVIEPESIISGLSILEYSIKSTLLLFKSELGESEQQKNQRTVHEFIAKKGGKVSRSKLIMSKILPGGSAQYDYVLETLIDSGLISVLKANNKANWEYLLLNQ